ncbi:hypothetical protein BZL54_21010 [Burkholderia ubonensis subsp. mesacidophila]|uniref:Uncharacterized protein n=1 Tax=Burkholderia ubonensis subsp. mesacidophila TaxID=265293 RepID=A0A2A4FCU8_9BURK|nr:hypothetical protein BZL54_21010 [Burkholderia ubonensis subsp. mesacidophila]
MHRHYSVLNQSDHLDEVRPFESNSFERRTLKEVGRPDGSIDRTVFTWDGDVLLMEERFHLPPRRRSCITNL